MKLCWVRRISSCAVACFANEFLMRVCVLMDVVCMNFVILMVLLE